MPPVSTGDDLSQTTAGEGRNDEAVLSLSANSTAYMFGKPLHSAATTAATTTTTAATTATTTTTTTSLNMRTPSSSSMTTTHNPYSSPIDDHHVQRSSTCIGSNLLTRIHSLQVNQQAPQHLDRLIYDIHSWSSHAANFHPSGVLLDRPRDQSSRWSAGSNDPDQFLTLRLVKPAIVHSITFGKFRSPHVCNVKLFKVKVGMSDNENEMVQVLYGMLANSTTKETFQLIKNGHLGMDSNSSSDSGIPLVAQYIRIEPLSSYDQKFNPSIWFVELVGVTDYELIEPALHMVSACQTNEAARLCAKFLRQFGLNSEANALIQRIYSDQQQQQQQQQQKCDMMDDIMSSSELFEHPLLTQLHAALVQNEDYAQADVILEQAYHSSLFNAYAEREPSRHSWTSLPAFPYIQPAASNIAASMHPSTMPVSTSHLSRSLSFAASSSPARPLTALRTNDVDIIDLVDETSDSDSDSDWITEDTSPSVSAGTLVSMSIGAGGGLGSSTSIMDSSLSSLPVSVTPSTTALGNDGSAPSESEILLPARRSGHQMWYDAESDRIFMFGGWDGTRDLGDLWSLSLQPLSDIQPGPPEWTRISACTQNEGGPSTRSCHATCYCPVTRCAYILDQYTDSDTRRQGSSSSVSSSLYQYNVVANVWTHLPQYGRDTDNGEFNGFGVADSSQSTIGPRLFMDAQMCIDSAAQVLYVFGGRAVQNDNREDILQGLYAYDIGTRTWRTIHNEATFYGSAGGGNGGSNSSNSSSSSNASERSGGSAVMLSPTNARVGHALIHDPLSNSIIMCYGVSNGGGGSLSRPCDILVYDIASRSTFHVPLSENNLLSTAAEQSQSSGSSISVTPSASWQSTSSNNEALHSQSAHHRRHRRRSSVIDILESSMAASTFIDTANSRRYIDQNQSQQQQQQQQQSQLSHNQHLRTLSRSQSSIRIHSPRPITSLQSLFPAPSPSPQQFTLRAFILPSSGGELRVIVGEPNHLHHSSGDMAPDSLFPGSPPGVAPSSSDSSAVDAYGYHSVGGSSSPIVNTVWTGYLQRGRKEPSEWSIRWSCEYSSASNLTSSSMDSSSSKQATGPVLSQSQPQLQSQLQSQSQSQTNATSETTPGQAMDAPNTRFASSGQQQTVQFDGQAQRHRQLERTLQGGLASSPALTASTNNNNTRHSAVSNRYGNGEATASRAFLDICPPRFSFHAIQRTDGQMNDSEPALIMFGGNSLVAAPASLSGNASPSLSRLNDIWMLKMARCTSLDILNRARYLVRSERFYDMCEYGVPSQMADGIGDDAEVNGRVHDPMAALRYLQTEVSKVVDHSDSAAVEQFQAMAMAILLPSATRESSSQGSSNDTSSPIDGVSCGGMLTAAVSTQSSQEQQQQQLQLQQQPQQQQSARNEVEVRRRQQRERLFDDICDLFESCLRQPSYSLQDLLTLCPSNLS